MNDQLISKTKVLTIATWTLAALLLASGWVVMLADDAAWHWAVMLSVTSLATTGVAMTMHFRCYVLRLVGLIRATAGLKSDGGKLHTIP